MTATIISVVRNVDMFNVCIRDNANLSDCRIVMVDNRQENMGLPTRYNDFLDSFDFSHDTWFVFCHEDLQFLEPITPILCECDKNCIFGTLGVRTRIRYPILLGGYWQSEMLGEIWQSNKDGTNRRKLGRACTHPTEIETLDCQCLIVHSDLVKKFGLRFDANLTFDLYVEDFCIAAKENHGVRSMVLPLRVQHWSGGVIGERYLCAEKYMERKYQKSYYSVPARFAIGGGALRKLQLYCDRSGITSRIMRSCQRILNI